MSQLSNYALKIFFMPILSILAYNRKIPKEQTFKDFRIPGVELSNLRELPRRSNFITANNIFYSGGPLTDIEIAALPQIKREQVSQSKNALPAVERVLEMARTSSMKYIVG